MLVVGRFVPEQFAQPKPFLKILFFERAHLKFGIPCHWKMILTSLSANEQTHFKNKKAESQGETRLFNLPLKTILLFRARVCALSCKSSKAFFNCKSSCCAGFGVRLRRGRRLQPAAAGFVHPAGQPDLQTSSGSGVSGRLTSTEGLTPELARSSARKVLPLAEAHFATVRSNPSPPRRGKSIAARFPRRNCFRRRLRRVGGRESPKRRLRPRPPFPNQSKRRLFRQTNVLLASAVNVCMNFIFASDDLRQISVFDKQIGNCDALRSILPAATPRKSRTIFCTPCFVQILNLRLRMSFASPSSRL